MMRSEYVTGILAIVTLFAGLVFSEEKSLEVKGDEKKIDVRKFLDEQWEAITPTDILHLMNTQLLGDQSQETKDKWRAFLSEIIKGDSNQYQALKKSGLLESAKGDCLVALNALATMLHPVLSVAKNLDCAFENNKYVNLVEKWKRIYKFILDGQLVQAAKSIEENNKDFALLDAYDRRLLEKLQSRLSSQSIEKNAAKTSEK